MNPRVFRLIRSLVFSLIALFFVYSPGFADSKQDAINAQLAAQAKAQRDLADTAKKNHLATEDGLRKLVLENSAERKLAEAAALSARTASAEANANAILAIEAAHENTGELLKTAAAERWGTYTTLIVQTFGFLTVIAGFAWQYISARLNHNAALKKIDESTNAAVETKKSMASLEKNTNSKMDTLLKTTREAEFAKGLKQGTSEKRAMSAKKRHAD